MGNTQALGFDDDAEFWRADLAADNPCGPLLLERGFEGLALGLPARVDVRRRDTLPALAVLAGPASLGARYDLAEETVAVMVEAERGAVLVGEITRREYPTLDRPRDDRSTPSNPGLELSVAECRAAELRSLLTVPWEPGVWSVTLLNRDLATEAARVELFDPSRVDDAFPTTVRDQEPVLVHPLRVTPQPALGVAVYLPVQGSPAPPDAIGIRIAAEGPTVMRRGATAVLFGSWRLPVRLRHRVSSSEAWAIVPEGVTPPSAVLDVTLVALGADALGPAVISLKLPTWDALPPGDSVVATGYFALDLLAVPDLGRAPQTLYLYAFSQGLRSEVLRLSLVDPALLPDGG